MALEWSGWSKRRFGLVAVLFVVFAALPAVAGAEDVAKEPDGFISLFNGKNLDGWVIDGVKTYKDGAQEKPVWTVEDGMLQCAGKGFGFLRYDKPFDDFTLHVEYQMSKGGNSGIGIRTVKFTGPFKTRPSAAAYEIQLLDDAGRKPSPKTTGSLYRYIAPKVNAVRPAPQWNVMDITCIGPRIRIVHNGQEIINVDQREHEKIKGKPLRGYVCVQNHGRKVAFRNIRLRPIKATPAPAR